MEAAGSQRKRPNVWQFWFPRFVSTNTPSKIGYEKRRLSLRSENTTITETTTPQSSSSLFRQAFGLSQKQPGKENQSPSILQDSTVKVRAIIAKSTTKRNKPSSQTNYITDSEKKVIRRRLSGDYEDQLSSNTFYRAAPIEPIIFSAKAIHPSESSTKRFSVYGDENAGSSKLESTASTVYVDAQIPDGKITASDNSAERNVKNNGSSRAQHSTDVQQFFNSRSTEEQKISGGEFRIEKIDSQGSTMPINKKFREIKSGSDIRRLNFSVRRGDDVSPLKRRMNQLIRSRTFAGESYGANNKGASATTAAKIALESLEVARKGEESVVLCSDETKLIVDPSTGAMRKKCIRTSSETKRISEGGSEISVTSAMQQSSNESQFFYSRPPRETEISGAEFRIERVERIGGRTPTMLDIGKMKSGSDIRRLNISVRRGDDVSPLKRRMNQLIRSRAFAEKSYGVNNKDASATTAAKIKSESLEVARKVEESVVPCSDETKLTVDPSTGAIRKKCIRTSSETKRISQDGSERSVPSTMQQSSNESQFFYSHPPREREISGAEFRIERVERIGGRTPTMLDIGKMKSGSDTGRLEVATKKGEDISRLKGRINRLKAPGVTVGRSCGFGKRGAEAVFAGRVDDSDSKMGLMRRPKRRLVPCPDEAGEREYSFEKSIPDSTTGAAKKKTTSSEAKQFIISEIKLATDYRKETIDLEYAREQHCYRISESFLKGKAVTPEQRRIVVNFLISVHAYLSTSSSTCYQATKIFDAILDIKDVSVKELQLVALAALWIAIKNMETRIPTASEMISFAKDLYHAEGPGLLCKCERKILKTLGFHIRFSDPYHISAYYLRQWSVSDESLILKKIYHCAGYLMDVALLDENYSSMSGQLLATAATQAAANLVLNTSDEKHEMKNSSSNTEKSTKYTQEEVDRVVGPLLRGVLDSAVKDSPIGAVYNKYKNSRFDNASDYLVTSIKKFSSLIGEGKN